MEFQGKLSESLPGPAVSSGEAGGPRLSLIAVQGTGWAGKGHLAPHAFLHQGLALQACLGWDWYKVRTREPRYFSILLASPLLEALGKSTGCPAILS